MSCEYSTLFYQLNKEEKKRYQEKIVLIGNMDPYTLQSAQLSER